MINAASLKIKDAYRKLLKNQVYLDLRSQGKDIYFYSTSDWYEIDFVTIDKHGNREIIRVIWDISDPKTQNREQRALQQAGSVKTYLPRHLGVFQITCIITYLFNGFNYLFTTLSTDFVDKVDCTTANHLMIKYIIFNKLLRYGNF